VLDGAPDPPAACSGLDEQDSDLVLCGIEWLVWKRHRGGDCRGLGEAEGIVLARDRGAEPDEDAPSSLSVGFPRTLHVGLLE